MQTIVLAAGQGTRMRPLTEQYPKPMLPVVGKPIAAHTVEAAVEAGASRIVLVVGYMEEVVRDYFGEEYAGVQIEYAVQTEQRGTADAVRAADSKLDDAPFAVLNGDALYDGSSLTALFDEKPSVGSFRVDNPSQYGVLHTTDDETTATGVVEKPADPPSNLINAGAYVFPGEARSWLDVGESERGEIELTDVLSRTCDEYEVSVVPFDRWLDIGRPWELLEANEWKLDAIANDREGTVSENAELNDLVFVHEDAEVRPGTVIDGPVYIDAGATVGPNAFVRGSTYIGPDAKVGNAVEVKNSVLMDGATVGHLSYVGDSVLGRDVNLGAGTKVANLRHDDEPVETPVKGELTSTGRRKFGVVMGDRAKTGINTSLNAGVKLPMEGTTKPGETVLFDPES
ncbi:bifunctional sugar-1-phosphate nucleotidylyltransferase/acetyltransferase [Haloarchaeobius sp. TZWSO28]|uniref:bifunctional sugar-1-phosphate nucleotidylyltransferase/acetyltransferase n=1 Tax=Haloarchaeobius sp. TZWSO28 TaxID=3446119 RepID=UPI003EB96172